VEVLLSASIVGSIIMMGSIQHTAVYGEELMWSADASEDQPSSSYHDRSSSSSSSTHPSRDQVLICNDDESILDEHTYLDVIDHIIMPYDELNLKQQQQATVHASSSSILHRKVKLKAIMSYGEFVVSYGGKTQQNYTFNDIYLLQERGLLMSYVCGSSLLSAGPNGWLSELCRCGSTRQSLPRDELLDSLRTTQYCVSQSGCTDKSIAEGYCRIRVDPFINSCVVISTRSSDRVRWDEDAIRRSVKYKYHIPTLRSDLSDLLALSGHDLEALWTFYPITTLLSLIPTSLFCLVVGWMMISYSREMSETWLVQLLVEVMMGVGLALLLIVYLCYWLYR
jgi:hypothetical protein